MVVEFVFVVARIKDSLSLQRRSDGAQYRQQLFFGALFDFKKNGSKTKTD